MESPLVHSPNVDTPSSQPLLLTKPKPSPTPAPESNPACESSDSASTSSQPDKESDNQIILSSDLEEDPNVWIARLDLYLRDKAILQSGLTMVLYMLP